MPVWAIAALVVVGGWVLANFAVHVEEMYLDAIVRAMPEPDLDDPIVQRWEADGARMLFALFFGWAYGPVLWVLWSPVFAVVWVVRRLRARQPRPVA